MKRVWSENQLEVINSNEKKILVSASAGSGKTTVMIERILRLLADGEKISSMLVCTFTRASAADMRAKLYVELVKRGLKKELKDLASAEICTIDSFCQRLITKYFYALGIDPQFEMLEESEAKAMRKRAVAQSIEFCSSDENFAYLRQALRNNRKDSTLENAMLAIMNYKSITPQSEQPKIYNHKDVLDELNNYADSLKAKTYAAVEELFSEINEPESYAELISALKNDNGVVSFEPRRKYKKENEHLKPCFKYIKDRVSKTVEALNDINGLRAQSESEPLILSLVYAVEYAEKVYETEKKKRSVCDFSDLEKMALEILKSEFSDEIRAKYKYVFVDEYQDINPLQEEIIRLVSLGNNLFMVGDIKQSIYAFRGCDPSIFKNKYDMYANPEIGKRISLSTNYRSSKRVIEFVNEVFSHVMTDEFGGIDYASNKMVNAKDSQGYVKFHVVTGNEKYKPCGVYSVKNHDVDRLTKMEAEATLVAYRITELLKTEYNGKPVAFSDIAILTRSMGTLENMVLSKLREINIPVSLTEEAFYLTRPETGQLISYLRLIDNRHDDIAMAIAMLSPLGGFDENELANIKINGEGAFYSKVLSAATHNQKVNDFLTKLDRYCDLSRVLSVDELADVIVSENGYFNYAYSLSEDAAEILDKFLQFLNGCPTKNSLKATLSLIDERNPCAELSGAENSVKFMTVHKSKGLEFKFVFVIGLGESFNLKDLHKKVYEGEPIAMPIYEEHQEFNSDLRYLRMLTASKKQLEEELRILYVALTRAEEGLELFASLSDSDYECDAITQKIEIVDMSQCKSALKWLAPLMYMAKRYDVSDIELQAAAPRKILFAKADEDVVKELKNYFNFVAPEQVAAKSYVSFLAHKDDEENAVYLTSEESSYDALARGNAYHKAMELIDFCNPSIDVLDGVDLSLVDTDKLLYAASRMREFKGDVYKEKPFMLKLSASEAGLSGSGQVLVQGVIDLMVVDGDNVTVVDYKTGKIHSALEDGYAKQVNLYAKAVERLLGKKVVGKFLYYFDAKEFVEIR